MLSGGTDAAYRALVNTGGTFMRRLEVWKNGVRVDTAGDSGIEVIGAALNANLENRVTRRLTVNVPTSLFPVNNGDLLDPNEAELVLWCGWRGGAAAPYMWPVFTGPVLTVSWSTAQPTVQVDASDRVEQIVEDKFISPVSSGAGTLVTTRIKDLISDSQPGAQFGTFDETGASVPALVWEADRAQALDDLAAGVGCYWYQLPDGLYTLRRIPWGDATLPDPVVTIVDGTDGGRTTASKSRTGVYTICQVVGEAADGSEPVSGTVYDTDPTSPTYYLGPLGRRVLKVQQDSVASVAQAESLARQRQRRSRAFEARISTTSTFDPAMELGDVAMIVTEIGSFRRALASFSADLGTNPTMSAQWRSPGDEVEQ